jgi:membrane protease YdiL (CAAX protease family)
MPPEVAQRAERIGQYVLWLRHGLVLAFVLGTAALQSLAFSQIGLRLDGWQLNTLIGVGAGALQVGLQRLFWRLRRLPNANDKRLAAQPRANWILSQLFSVLAEELWLAFCVVSLVRAGHSALVAVLLPATVFGALHHQYRVGAIATGGYGAISASLFLWRGSLMPPYLFHFIGNIGALYWSRRGAALLRRDEV